MASCIFITTLLYGQSTAELRLQKVELETRIVRIQKQMEEEDERLARFKEQKQLQQQQKREEIVGLKKEIIAREREVMKARRDVTEVQLKKTRIAEGEEVLLQLVLKHAHALQETMADFPFDIKKREGSASSLAFDIEGKRITASEAVNRFLNILDNEISMSYDSAAVATTLKIDDKSVFGTMLRIGRIYLAFIAEEGVWEFSPIEDKDGMLSFVISSETAFLQRERTVRSMLDMVQGRKPPNFEILPIPWSHLKVGK